MSFRPSLVQLSVILAFAAGTSGCASRVAPFDELDQAQITIMRLQAAQPQQAAPQPGGMPLIPGIPPELQQLGQQVLEQIGPHVPPGLLPPGLLPVPGGQPAPQVRLYQNQWAIAGEMPLMDEDAKDKLLDLFGDADSFDNTGRNCYNAGMAVSFRTPDRIEPVDVVVSFSCNQAWGYGFQWPHAAAGFKNESRTTLTDIYTRVWGAPPPPDA